MTKLAPTLGPQFGLFKKILKNPPLAPGKMWILRKYMEGAARIFRAVEGGFLRVRSRLAGRPGPRRNKTLRHRMERPLGGGPRSSYEQCL
jgi:hypothetical protein